MQCPAIIQINKVPAKGLDKKPVKRSLSPAVLESLLPSVFAVIADTDNDRLIIDCLAVRPLGIFRTTLRTV
jgi:hypothetical protein